MIAAALALAVLGLPHEGVDGARLMATLRELPTQRAPGLTEEHREGLRATERLIVERLRAAGLAPMMHEFAWASPFRDEGESSEREGQKPASLYHNIIVDLRGKGAAGEVVLIGAHYDAVPQAPGADDNGTGVAALLEMATLYAKELADGAATRRTIRLAFFNLEENGCIGSAAYYRDWRKSNPANAPDGSKDGGETEKQHETDLPQPAVFSRTRGEKIVAMLSLETMGFFSDEPNSQKSPFPPNLELPGGVKIEMPSVGDFIAVVGIAKHKDLIQSLTREMKVAAPGLKTFDTAFAPVALPDMLRSDHRAFLLNGIPAVMVTDSANFRNPNYHKATDTIETIDAARFTLLTKGLVGAVWAIAEPVAPKGLPAKDKNDKWHE